MKRLGRTEENGTIIELGPEETQLFARLGKAAEGRFSDWPWRPDYLADAEVEDVFRAILLWLDQGCRLKELEQAVKSLKTALGITNLLDVHTEIEEA